MDEHAELYFCLIGKKNGGIRLGPLSRNVLLLNCTVEFSNLIGEGVSSKFFDQQKKAVGQNH